MGDCQAKRFENMAKLRMKPIHVVFSRTRGVNGGPNHRRDLPPRSTLYDYFDLWSWDRTLDLIHHELYVKCREAIGREASPTAAVIDSRPRTKGG